MKKISFGFLFPLIALIILITAMSRKVFMIPPLGCLLNPFSGVVQNEKKNDSNLDLNFGRNEPIEILFDERSVPHLFAQNDKDLFFSQGYVTASNRLWQMDFLSYVAAGRLSEILGEDFLDNDREQRRSGILKSAKTSLKFIEANPETKLAMDNYTEGVNKYIEGLNKTNLPFEYKVLDYKPETWTNLKSVLIIKYMGALLSGYEEDLTSTYLLAALGEKEYRKLFSNYIINENKKKFSIAVVGDSLFSNSYIDFSFIEATPKIENNPYNPRLGSNSWVVGPKKSASGNAILCNDPHLNLSFPAIWYEIQLNSKDMNVYGYSIPGTPGVIIGYNQNISWGVTSGCMDVRDYYKLELKDDHSQYKFDGVWKNTNRSIEEIKVRNGKTYHDTIYYTIHGPISSDFNFGKSEKAGLASNWTLYYPSNEFLTFIKLNKASNYKDFKNALQYYKCPVQNFSYADVHGNIATHVQGNIIKRRVNGRGKFVLDGTRSEFLSKEMLIQELPFTYNPDQGFVCSANNNPFMPGDSFYVNGHYSELRSSKIKQLLLRSQNIRVEDMEAMQLDNTNRLAELAVPILLNFVSVDHNDYKMKFSNWDYKYTKETEMAYAFECWWALIQQYTWDELRKFNKVDKLPDDLVLLDLISNDPDNKYFDRLSTDKRETAGDIIQQAFDKLSQSRLSIFPINWGTFNKIDIRHLLEIPGLNRNSISSPSCANAINALSDNWGPSLRFIVEMDKIPQGYGIYAGGQSGDPASNEYDIFVENWLSGKYYKLNFFITKKEALQKTKYKWIIY